MRYIFQDAPEPTSILAGSIWVFENIVPNWKEIIDNVEKEVSDKDSGVAYSPAKTRDGKTTGLRRNKVLPITEKALAGNGVCKTIHNQVGILLDECLGKYSTYYETTFYEHEDYGLLKYEGATGDHYDAHYDGGPSTKRWISAIIYLNSDYEGGEIEFVDFNLKIKPKNGTLMIFPSNYAYRHIAHTVKSGTKYAIVTWITGD